MPERAQIQMLVETPLGLVPVDDFEKLLLLRQASKGRGNIVHRAARCRCQRSR